MLAINSRLVPVSTTRRVHLLRNTHVLCTLEVPVPATSSVAPSPLNSLHAFRNETLFAVGHWSDGA